MNSFSKIRALAALLCAFAVVPVYSQTNFATLAADGGWCWFSDPRALFHNGTLYFGCVRSDGHSVLNEFNLQTGTMTNLWVSSLTEFDDHDVCGMQVRQDGTIFANWARHGGDQFFCYRISTSTNPVSPSDWGTEQQIAPSGSGLTYCNPYQLSAEGGTIYSFSRDLNYNPTVFTSTDDGATWSGPTLMIKTGTGGTRPYVKYCSNYTNRIDVLYTDAHPDNYTTSLYEMYYQNGAFYQTDGTFVTNYSTLPILHDSGQRGSVVYQYNTAAQSDPNQWIPYARAWCWEMGYQTNGAPVCVFQTKVDNVTGSTWADARIYYYYARWTGTNWQKRFVAQAGRPLYNGQPDYGGGMALDPADPNVIYISSDAANPFDLSTTTGIPLGAHYEIYKGVTSDGGLTFAWSAVTTNSTVDNCRPYVPRRFGGEPCVLWWRGVYNSYTSFYTSIVGMFTTAVPVTTNSPELPVPDSVPPAQIIKANNTTALNQGGSWAGGSTPGAGDMAVWDSTVTSANSVALGANASWAGITVTNAGGLVTITPGNMLTLGASGVDMTGATANLNINSSLALASGNQIWTIPSGRSLALGTGTFTRGNGATLNIQGAGTVTSSMSGLNSTETGNPSPGMIGPWLTIGTGTGTRYATTNAGNIAGYTGFAAAAFNWSTTMPNFTNYEISGTSAAIGIDRMCNTIRWTGGAATQNYGSGSSTNRLFVRGILNAGMGTLTFVKASGGPTFVPGTNSTGGNRELVLNAAAAGVVVGVPIADNASVASSVIVTGSGTNTVTLSAINTYTGGTTLNAGGLNLGNASGLGSTNGALTVNGGTLDLGNYSSTVGAVVINGGIIQNGTLTGASFAANNANSAGVSAVLTGASATLSKSGSGILALAAPNTYGGLTTVNAGMLDCLGGISGPVVIAGGTLCGDGMISGAVTNQAGILMPGTDAASIGTLTISSVLVLQAAGTTLIKISKNGDGVINDSIQGMTGVFYGGTLVVTNIGGVALAAGDAVQIFSAGSYNGSFSNIILPLLATNLYWTNNLAMNGTLIVKSTVSNVPTNLVSSVSGTNLDLSWPADHIGWRLQMQTNVLSAGLGTNWVDVPGASFTNHVVLPVIISNGSVFYRLVYP